VAGIATVATATASVTVIAATAQPDPIFAALAKCREKEAGWLALCDRDDVLAIVPDKPLRQQIESAQEQYQEAEGRLAEVVPPTTALGCVALIGYIVQDKKAGDAGWHDRAIANSAVAITRLEQPKLL
jgi:hypothetical protein